MKPFVHFFLLGFWITPALAGTALDSGAFQALTIGKSIHYSLGGTPYGSEQYLPGQQVIRRDPAGRCKEGSWYPRDGEICFVYEGNRAAQCWQFHESPTGLMAYHPDDQTAFQLIEVSRSSDHLDCETGSDG